MRITQLNQTQAKQLRLLVDYIAYRNGEEPSELKGSFLEWLSDKGVNPKNVIVTIKNFDAALDEVTNPNKVQV